MSHAVLHIGTRSDAFGALGGISETETDPDVIVREYATFGIDDASALRHEANLRPVVRDERVFVLILTTVTVEAQNALLKIFEEPLASQFHIIVSSEDTLIPTLRSRMRVERYATGIDPNAQALAQAFLAAPYTERLADVAAGAKNKDDAWFRGVLRGLEEGYTKTLPPDALTAVVFVHMYIEHRGASKKMLFEYLALSLPVISHTKQNLGV